jgi:hypothetical protein
MTRKSRREIETDVDELTAETTVDAPELAIVYEDPDTGEWFRGETHEDPIDPAVAEQAAPVMILSTDYPRNR